MTSVEALRSRLERSASRGTVAGDGAEAENAWTSRLGQVRVLGSQESWPEHDNEPMAGVCQINVLELPHVPEALADVAILTIFMATENGAPLPPSDAPNGQGWELRTYSTLHDLTVVSDTTAAIVRPAPVAWERIPTDLPAWDDAARLLEPEEFALVDENYEEILGRPADGLKVGGWPSLIQSEIFWAPWNRHPAEPDFVLQIDSEPTAGLMWGDAGIVYVGRGTADRSVWTLTWQCM